MKHQVHAIDCVGQRRMTYEKHFEEDATRKSLYGSDRVNLLISKQIRSDIANLLALGRHLQDLSQPHKES